MDKINNLTGVRAFAALWVLVYHMPQNRGIGQFTWGSFINHGYLGVDIFFVLSGFILTHVYAERFLTDGINLKLYKQFIIKRFARIYPLHLFTFSVFVVIWGIGKFLNYTFGDPAGFSLQDAIYHLLLMHGWGLSDHLSWNRLSWSISAEWFAYLLVFPFAIYVLLRGNLKVLGIAVLLSWIIGFGYAFDYRGNIGLTHNAIPRIIFEFLAGVLCNRLARFPFIKRQGGGLFWLGLLGLIIITQVNPLFEFFTLPAIVCLILGLNNGSVLSDKLFGNAVAIFLGETSFSLYMTHPIVNIGFNQVMQRLAAHPTQLQAIALMLVMTLMSIAFAATCFYLIEKKGQVFVLKKLMPVN
ncbi:MAG: acyltransferase [Methylococcales bacterium]|nr:acyltransferase [Methylococcales bacterium]